MRELWRGAPTVAAGCVPSHAAFFSVYEYAKEATGANKPGHHPLAAASAGAAATMLHDLILTPVDVVKQRLQLGLYRGALDCARQVLRKEGLMAFFRSYPTTVAMSVPFQAVMVASNESLRKVIDPSGNVSIGTALGAGAVAGGIAALATNPFDVIKTRLQTQGLHAPSPSMGATATPSMEPGMALRAGTAAAGGGAGGSTATGGQGHGAGR